MVFALAGCENEPKTLYRSTSIVVIKNSSKTLVFDLVSDKEYSFLSIRKKRSNSITKPHTTVDTNTIKIDIIPSGLRVYDKTANKIFTYQRKYLHSKG